MAMSMPHIFYIAHINHAWIIFQLVTRKSARKTRVILTLFALTCHLRDAFIFLRVCRASYVNYVISLTLPQNDTLVIAPCVYDITILTKVEAYSWIIIIVISENFINYNFTSFKEKFKIFQIDMLENNLLFLDCDYSIEIYRIDT